MPDQPTDPDRDTHTVLAEALADLYAAPAIGALPLDHLDQAQPAPPAWDPAAAIRDPAR